MLLRTIARPLLSVVFIGQGLESLRNPQAAADAARPTLDGLRRLPTPVTAKVPADTAGVETFARVNAGVQVGAGALLASGKLPRVASAALACTVIPGRVGAHMFWAEDDRDVKARMRRDFLADLSLLGGLMIASADTAGQPSLGWRGRRAAQRLSEAVTAATAGGGSEGDLGEKLAHGVQTAVDRGRELVSAALKKGAPLMDAAWERGGELAESALERGSELAASTRRLAQSVS
ncbi:MAG TPA: DoxX family protein [Mycobacterium sp.]|nr:DoxX family protein [Mycobacterium sp.]